MAYWDLNKTQREALKKAVVARDSMLKRDICPPDELCAHALMQKYSLTEADWKATWKAFVK